MRVLIAEDDPMSRLILHKAVEKLGHQCFDAPDGDSAWDQYLAETPDVVITDWMMPGIDGSEVVRRIREQPRYCYVVMVTALRGDADAQAGMSACADAYLRKPVDIAQLKLALIAAQRMTTR